MLNSTFVDEVSQKIHRMIAESPAGDLEKNLRALLQAVFARLDLVTREEFDVQTEVLAHTRRKLETLEQKLASLETQTKKAG